MSGNSQPPRSALTWRLPVLVVSAWLTTVMLAAAGWIRYRFGALTFDQVLLNLPLEAGEGIGNDQLAIDAALWCLGLPTLIVTAGTAWFLHRRTRRRPARRLGLAAGLSFGAALSLLLVVVGIPQFAVAELDPRSVEPYYVTPTVIRTPEKPLNLITIYLESVENTYSDDARFGSNLLSELDRATTGWAAYQGLQQYQGGGWTMAGIVSTQCGIPLKSRVLVAGANPNTYGEHVQRYLPGARCLGDVLAEQGYTSAFVGGANTGFGGKSTYLADHGYQVIRGRAEWEAEGEDPSNITVWGMSDARLMPRAIQAVTELEAAGAPYHLTVLTLDTHEPAGIFDTCTTEDEVPMATAVRCSTRAVAGFLDHLAGAGVLENTVVQVMGDHLKATVEGGDFKSILEATPDRTILYRVWSPKGVRFSREVTDQLSVLPSTLELLGFEVPQGRAGLGVSFVGEHDLYGSLAALDPAESQAVVASRSTSFYQRMWTEP